jgi:predicted O-methyltransferase YrrM
MNPLQKAALWVPAIRRLRDARDELLAERASLLTQAASAAQENREVLAVNTARAEGRLIITEYAYHPRSRPSETAAGGRRLTARLLAEEEHYAATLRGVAEHAASLARIPRTEEAGGPFWENDWFPPFDGVSLYGLVAQCAPRRYIEVGSGMSTRFARQAIRDLGLRTRIVSIDPHPHTVVDALCDEVVRSRMEDVPQAFWEEIGPDDLLFVDNSHRSFPNSDVTVFFAEALPALRPGTIWGMHDIFLPWDYPEHWRDRFYNEQYLLLAYLLGGADGDEIMLPVHWAASRPSLHGILTSLWAHEDLFRNAGTGGGCFWMRRGAGTFT